jgi:hypothetical protein
LIYICVKSGEIFIYDTRANSMNKRTSMLFTIAAVAVMGATYSEAHTHKPKLLDKH